MNKSRLKAANPWALASPCDESIDSLTNLHRLQNWSGQEKNAGYLQGQKAPTTESSEANKHTAGGEK
jgi:hypothetical protein